MEWVAVVLLTALFILLSKCFVCLINDWDGVRISLEVFFGVNILLNLYL